MKNIPVIPKEQLNTVHFPKTEVLPDSVSRKMRIYDLQRALILGNLYHCKVNIIFKTEDDTLKQVESTIWAVTDDFILLKGGMFIPVKAIVDLEF